MTQNGQNTVESFQELKKVYGENHNHADQNNRETCPACGNRTRYPEHPMCPKCNKLYIEETADAALSDDLNPISRIDWAKKKGQETLKKMKEEYQQAQEKERLVQKPFWNEAFAIVQNKLKAKGIGRIDSKAFNKAKGKVFTELWGSEKPQIDCSLSKNERELLSRKIRGLKKAIESLEIFLDQVEEKAPVQQEKKE